MANIQVTLHLPFERLFQAIEECPRLVMAPMCPRFSRRPLQP